VRHGRCYRRRRLSERPSRKAAETAAAYKALLEVNSKLESRVDRYEKMHKDAIKALVGEV
jgi:hypothetical protein